MSSLAASPRRRWSGFSHWIAFIFIAHAFAICWSAQRSQETESKIHVDRGTHDTSYEADQIKLMIAKYAKSVDEADTALASQVWWNSPEVSFIHPLGHEHGLELIKQHVYKHLMGETFSDRKLNIHDVSVHVYGDAAWAEFYWDFVATLRKNGSQIATHGRETQVYWKMQDGWHLVHVHYSGMPVTEERKGF